MEAVKDSLLAANLAALGDAHPRLALQLQFEKERQLIAPAVRASCDEKKLEAIEVLYLFGWGRQDEVASFVEWAADQTHRRLILLIPSLAHFAAILETSDWTSIFGCKQVGFFLHDESIHEVIWQAVHRRTLFLNLATPKGTLHCQGEAVRQELAALTWEGEGALAAVGDFGLASFENVHRNLHSAKSLVATEALKGRFAQVPAVICGAGPSLEGELVTLQQSAGQALIFAAGSALSCLERGGVQPHFAAMLDPDVPLQRIQRQSSWMVPLLCQLQVTSSLFETFEEKKIAFCAHTTTLMQKELLRAAGLTVRPFEAGWHALNFAAHCAYWLGCSPLIFVGMESATRGQAVYAAGASYPDEPEKSMRIDHIPCVDQMGEQVFSRPDFLLGKKWLEVFAQEHRDAVWINATPQGLCYEGMEQMALSAALTSYSRRSRDLKGEVHAALATQPQVAIDRRGIAQTVALFKQSARQCLACVEEWLKGDRGKQLVAYFELEEEYFYREALAPLWEVWRHLLQRGEVVAAMKETSLECRLQEIIFFKRVCADYVALFSRLECRT